MKRTTTKPQQFLIEVTRAEFLKIPMPLRRKTLKKHSAQMLLLKQWEKKWMAAVETANSISTKSIIAREALDALALALTAHKHKFSPDERMLYECATETCTGTKHSKYCKKANPS